MDHRSRGKRQMALGVLLALVLVALAVGAPLAIAIDSVMDGLPRPFS